MIEYEKMTFTCGFFVKVDTNLVGHTVEVDFFSQEELFHDHVVL